MKVHVFSSRMDPGWDGNFALEILLFSPETMIKSKTNRADAILSRHAIMQLLQRRERDLFPTSVK
jgi:hypothetical protein